MALSDADVQKQIKHMMAFIEQEANEKAEEIDAKAEEEFNLEKGRLVTEQRLKIMEFYDRKDKQVELQRRIQESHMQNKARLNVLKSREEHILNVLEDAKKQLVAMTKDQNSYSTVLQKLISQGLCQLVEKEISVRCRKQDVTLVQNCINKAVEEYQEKTKKTCNVVLEQNSFLPDDSAGGVELITMKGKIKCCNTLDSRLDMISQQLLPEIRVALFGRNPNRKFDD